MGRLLSAAPLAFLLTASCSPHEAMERAAASAEGRYARETLDLALGRDQEALLARMTPAVVEEATAEQMARLFQELPAGTPSAPQLVEYNWIRSGKMSRADYTYEYRYPEGWLLGHVVLDSSAGPPRVAGIHLRRMPDALARINAFSSSPPSPVRLAFLASAAAVVGTILCALVACLRMRGLRRRWLWLAFIAVGIGRLMLNWTTGEVRVMPLAFDLLGASIYRHGLYGPWTLAVSLPIGAVWFLSRRGRLAEQRERDLAREAPSAFE